MLTHPQFDPIALSLGPVNLHWYGLMYFFGFLLFIYFGKKQIANQPWSLINTKILDDMFFYGALGVILGGRLGYVFFYQPHHYLNNPAEIFAFWQGGMSFHGGFLGVLIGMILIAKKYKIKWLALTDFIAPLVPLGLGFGRIGNFINQELWGRPTEVAWGMIFPAVDNITRHPSQIYQSFFEGFILFLILWFYAKNKGELERYLPYFYFFMDYLDLLLNIQESPIVILVYFT